MRHIIVLFFACTMFQWARAQWTGTTDIYKTTAGNVGIGTTTPWSTMDIRTSGAAGTGQYGLNVQNPSTDAYSTININLGSGPTSHSLISTQRNNLGNGAYMFFQSTDASGTMQNRVTISDIGNVGIGTYTPITMLTVSGAGQNDGIWLTSTGAPTNVALLNNTTQGAWNGLTQLGDNLILWKGSAPDNSSAGGLVLGPWSNGYSGMRITSTGNVLIGQGTQVNSSYKLDIAGSVRAAKLVVNSNGADYVFDPGYRLMPLVRVGDSIRANHHLPGIAPAGQIQREGMDLGENQTRLLAKIEELTLYIIEQNKSSKEQDRKLKKQEERIRRLEELVEGKDK
jgi:hypothetical protein